MVSSPPVWLTTPLPLYPTTVTSAVIVPPDRFSVPAEPAEYPRAVWLVVAALSDPPVMVSTPVPPYPIVAPDVWYEPAEIRACPWLPPNGAT